MPAQAPRDGFTAGRAFLTNLAKKKAQLDMNRVGLFFMFIFLSLFQSELKRDKRLNAGFNTNIV